MGWVLAVADINRLLDLWQSGLSASRIAGLLGVTRNSVAGHVSRARAKGDARAAYKEQFVRVRKPKPPKPAKPQAESLERVLITPKPRVVKVTAPRVQLTPPVEPVPLVDCRPGCCRWPVAQDERGHLFCDAPVEPGARPQWCAEHRAIGVARAA